MKNTLLEKISKLRANAMFLAIRNYENEFSEISDFSLLFHVNYLNLIKKSKEITQRYKVNFKDCKDFSIVDLDSAKKELIQSYDFSLTGYNPFYTCHGVYDTVSDIDGNLIPGIKLHIKDNVLHLEGYRIDKRIIKPGKYPKINHAPLTLAKEFLRAKTPSNNWGQFKMTQNKFAFISVEKTKISNMDIG